MTDIQDLPLRQDTATRFTPWIIPLMTYLSSLSLIVCLTIFHFSHQWDQNLDGQISIEIPSHSVEQTQKLKDRTLAFLARLPEIKQIKIMNTSEAQKILNYWMQGDTLAANFPLPLIIDVDKHPHKALDITYMKKMLEAISPEIILTNHQDWQNKVLHLVHGTAGMTLFITLLIVSASLLTTAFATRTSLLIHHNVIEILYLVGATDIYIVKQFQKNALRQGLLAGTMGSTLVMVTLGILMFLFKGIEMPFITVTPFIFYTFIVILLMPFVTAALMILATRLTVLKTLHHH